MVVNNLESCRTVPHEAQNYVASQVMSRIIEQRIDVFGIHQRGQPVTFLLQRSPEIMVELFKSNKVSEIMKPKVPITCEFLHFFHSFGIFSVMVADNSSTKFALSYVRQFLHSLRLSLPFRLCLRLCRFKTPSGKLSRI